MTMHAESLEVLATKRDLAALRQVTREDMATLRMEMANMRGELRAEIHASASSVVRQMYLAVLGQSAVMLGFAYFVTTRLR